MIKPRDFQLDAWEFCRQNGAPGDVTLVKKAMEFGYGLGLKDATEEMRLLAQSIKQQKESSNLPR